MILNRVYCRRFFYPALRYQDCRVGNTVSVVELVVLANVRLSFRTTLLFSSVEEEFGLNI